MRSNVLKYIFWPFVAGALTAVIFWLSVLSAVSFVRYLDSASIAFHADRLDARDLQPGYYPMPEWDRCSGQYLWGETDVFGHVPERRRMVLNVKDFGAVGDGIHDDTEPIARAEDAARSHSCVHVTIFFPGGTYRTRAYLSLPSGDRIEGDPRHTTTIWRW